MLMWQAGFHLNNLSYQEVLNIYIYIYILNVYRLSDQIFFYLDPFLWAMLNFYYYLFPISLTKYFTNFEVTKVMPIIDLDKNK